MNILDQILEYKKEEVSRLKKKFYLGCQEPFPDRTEILMFGHEMFAPQLRDEPASAGKL